MRSWLLIFFADFVIDCILITLFVLVIYLYFQPSNYPPFWLSIFIFIYLSTQLSIFLATRLSLNFLFYEYPVDLYGDLRRIRRKWGERWVRGVVLCAVLLWSVVCRVLSYCGVWFVVWCGMVECCAVCRVSSVVSCVIVMCCVTLYCTREEYAYIHLKYTKE